MGTFGFEDGRRAQLGHLRDVLSTLPDQLAAGVWQPSWRRLLLAGIGASHAALASPLYQLRAGGLEAFRTDCSDFADLSGHRPDVVVALSQSGRSRETTDLVSRFTTAGVSTLSVTNSAASPLRDVSDRSVCCGDYQDSRVSTVGFVVTAAALGLICDIAATGRPDERWLDLPEVIERTADRATDTLRAFAAGPLATGSVDVVAHARHLSTAEAVALLFREGPLVPSAAYGTRGYLHGPMDCAGNDTSHLVIGGARELSLARQLTEKRVGVLAVTDGSEPIPPGVRHITVPADLTPAQRAVLEVCVLQELVSAVAAARGASIDEVAFTREDTKIAAVADL